MIVVPDSLKTEIRKLRGRKLQARCRIDFSGTTIDNTILGFGSSINNSGRYEQIFNGKEDVTHKWLSLDGSCTLDGTYFLAPETESESEKYEIGWWSEEISDDNNSMQDHQPRAFGDFAIGEQPFGKNITPPSVYVNFTSRQVSQINIAFDNARGEYAVDFDVVFWDINPNKLYTHSVTGNAGYKYRTDITTQTGVCMMELKIKKWSHAGRNVKVAEMYTMISQMITGEDMFSMQIVEDRELSDNSLPIGTTAASTCVISFFNRDRLYDWDNTESRLYNYIRKGVRIIPEIGDGTNWVPMGIYFAEEWDIPTDDLAVTVTGLDRMASLDESEYATSQAIEAPADQSYLTDTYAEWASGTMTGIKTDGNTIRLAFS